MGNVADLRMNLSDLRLRHHEGWCLIFCVLKSVTVFMQMPHFVLLPATGAAECNKNTKAFHKSQESLTGCLWFKDSLVSLLEGLSLASETLPLRLPSFFAFLSLRSDLYQSDSSPRSSSIPSHVSPWHFCPKKFPAP